MASARLATGPRPDLGTIPLTKAIACFGVVLISFLMLIFIDPSPLRDKLGKSAVNRKQGQQIDPEPPF